MKTKALQLIVLGFISMLLVVPALVIQPAMAADVPIDQMIEKAKTRADHEAIVAYYEDQAKIYNEKAEQHKKMSAAYRSMTPGKGGVAGFVAHCNKLMNKYGELAKENQELAKLHHKFAEQSAQ